MDRHDELYMVELLAGDDLATCPDCSDFAHPTATRCESCGAPLYPSNTTAGPRAHLGDGSEAQQKENSVMAPTGCTCGGQNICQACVLESYEPTLDAPLIRAYLAGQGRLEAALARPDNVTPLRPGHGFSMHVEPREPTDEEVTRRGPYLMDSRSENDRSL